MTNNDNYVDVIDNCFHNNIVNYQVYSKLINLYKVNNNVTLKLKKMFFSKEASYYDHANQTIYINEKKINDIVHVIVNRQCRILNLSERYQSLFKTFFKLHIIGHELRHVEQRIFYDDPCLQDKYQYLEDCIYTLCYNIMSHSDNYYYNRSLFPHEINANMISFSWLYNIINDNNLVNKHRTSLILIMIYQYILHVYQEGNPVDQIINNYCEVTECIYQKLISLMNESNLSFNDKIIYGLPLSDKEYLILNNYQNDEIDDMRKYLIKK